MTFEPIVGVDARHTETPLVGEAGQGIASHGISV